MNGSPNNLCNAFDHRSAKGFLQSHPYCPQRANHRFFQAKIFEYCNFLINALLLLVMCASDNADTLLL